MNYYIKYIRGSGYSLTQQEGQTINQFKINNDASNS